MISIVIPSWRRPQMIVGILANLVQQTVVGKMPIEALISIDQPDPEIDSYQSYISQFRDMTYDQSIPIDIKLIVNKTAGLVYAKNNAIRQAKYEYIMMMDDDLFMRNNYIEGLLRLLQRKNVGAASGYIVSYKPAISHTQPSSDVPKLPQEKILQRLKLNKVNNEWRSVFGSKEQVMNWTRIDPKYKKRTYGMDYFVNSYMFKKSIFEKIGGYNVQLNSNTSAHEEVEFTFRIKKLGYELLFSPRYMMYHLTVGNGGIYKGSSWDESQDILEKEYNDSLSVFINSIVSRHES